MRECAAPGAKFQLAAHPGDRVTGDHCPCGNRASHTKRLADRARRRTRGLTTHGYRGCKQ
eukprot:1896896-Prymnesium_polylepis.1